MQKPTLLRLLGYLELVFAAVAVIFDLMLPALVITLAGMILLLIRKEPIAVLGYRRPAGFGKLVGACFLWALLWTVVDYGLLLPILTRIAGETRNLNTYATLKGNVGMLLLMLAVGWGLGGLFEEFAFRGVLLSRARSLFPNQTLGLVLGILFTNVLFGFLHTEQGVVGVVITFIDAMFFTALKLKYQNTWAAALTHGFLNTIGIVTLFFTGPLPAFW